MPTRRAGLAGWDEIALNVWNVRGLRCVSAAERERWHMRASRMYISAAAAVAAGLRRVADQSRSGNGSDVGGGGEPADVQNCAALFDRRLWVEAQRPERKRAPSDMPRTPRDHIARRVPRPSRAPGTRCKAREGGAIVGPSAALRCADNTEWGLVPCFARSRIGGNPQRLSSRWHTPMGRVGAGRRFRIVPCAWPLSLHARSRSQTPADCRLGMRRLQASACTALRPGMGGGSGAPPPPATAPASEAFRDYDHPPERR
eukprot:365598-Chlamydomonas_euryale.AAC.2